MRERKKSNLPESRFFQRGHLLILNHQLLKQARRVAGSKVRESFSFKVRDVRRGVLVLDRVLG
jgi:hypothetical protein